MSLEIRHREYVHGGKLGDIVCSIPAFRACGATVYTLLDCGTSGHWAYRREVIEPLLHAQGITTRYLSGGGGVRAAGCWIHGDCFRDMLDGAGLGPGGRHLNLVERHLLSLQLPLAGAAVPWLAVEPLWVADYVFCRSSRYRPRDARVDWRFLALAARGRSVFLGVEAEAAAFAKEFGVDVPFYRTDDYLHAARVIAGSKLCVSNQTGLQTVMCGLQHPHVLEICEHASFVLFDWGGQYRSSSSFVASAVSRRFGPLYDDGEECDLEGVPQVGDQGLVGTDLASDPLLQQFGRDFDILR